MSSLQYLKKTIELLNKTRQIDIIRIFLNNNVTISENKNGSFINLTHINDKCLKELDEYLSYIADQENTLETQENVKQEFIKEHFETKLIENDNKDISICSTSNNAA